MLKAGDIYTTSKPTINPDAAASIRHYLSYHTTVPVEEIPVDYEADPPWEGGWEPVNRDGKIAKRISKWFKLRHGKSLDHYDLGQVGNYASRLVVPAGVKIEVTDQFDWNPGDFGDDDSCFFGGRRQTWSYLKHLGGRAAKIYVPDRAPGRCLILDEDKGYPVAFNFYGLSLAEGGAVWRAALPDDRISLNVRFQVAGSDHSPIYINHGSGHLIGRRKRTKAEVETDDFYLAREPDGGRHLRLYCEHCHIELDYNYAIPFARKTPALLCPDCYVTVKQRVLAGKTGTRWSKAELNTVPRLAQRQPAEAKAQVPEFYYATTSGNTIAIDNRAPTWDIRSPRRWDELNLQWLQEYEDAMQRALTRTIEETNRER